MNTISKEIKELKEMMKLNIDSKIKGMKEGDNIWFNTKRKENVKAKPVDTLLVINNSWNVANDKSKVDVIENEIIKNAIEINRTFKDRKGNIVLRMKLKMAEIN
eukprot:gene14746-16289_t